ncbi:hypothetical protein FIBSPDRAFT_882363 [Athelia psychrophila]|uniref:Uncharacterized protein n=1 Tax=Athelia psychrophila TaxID=1759441 RepID=A0A166V9K9_9AGAM|nr:hypothetical protein FIBSPDRAFT_882363 [Fibularhizoctonia sp. CBS 109695]
MTRPNISKHIQGQSSLTFRTMKSPAGIQTSERVRLRHRPFIHLAMHSFPSAETVVWDHEHNEWGLSYTLLQYSDARCMEGKIQLMVKQVTTSYVQAEGGKIQPNNASSDVDDSDTSRLSRTPEYQPQITTPTTTRQGNTNETSGMTTCWKLKEQNGGSSALKPSPRTIHQASGWLRRDSGEKYVTNDVHGLDFNVTVTGGWGGGGKGMGQKGRGGGRKWQVWRPEAQRRLVHCRSTALYPHVRQRTLDVVVGMAEKTKFPTFPPTHRSRWRHPLPDDGDLSHCEPGFVVCIEDNREPGCRLHLPNVLLGERGVRRDESFEEKSWDVGRWWENGGRIVVNVGGSDVACHVGAIPRCINVNILEGPWGRVGKDVIKLELGIGGRKEII